MRIIDNEYDRNRFFLDDLEHLITEIEYLKHTITVLHENNRNLRKTNDELHTFIVNQDLADDYIDFVTSKEEMPF